MINIKYFFQYLFISLLFIIFKIAGYKISIILSGTLTSLIGPLFRTNKLCHNNLSIAFPNLDDEKKKLIIKKMWINYGKILAEYMFIKDFRNSKKFEKNIDIKNLSILEQIKKENKPVIFISGHFNNFELMAMQIEKFGINLATIYRPLNNIFLNPKMEKIRRKFICKNQIRKGISGTKELLKFFKNGTSVALMIDQRVSEGIKCKFFNQYAFTTTIPAQFVKKFNAKIVPVYIERNKENNFEIKFLKMIDFTQDESTEAITLKLNKILEDMIIKNPEQWIWTHNRWK